MKILGVIPAYNEQDCIAVCLRAMSRITRNIHVFDHGSTDDTAKIAAKWAMIHDVSRDQVPAVGPDGVQSSALWHLIGDFIRGCRDVDAVVWHDADEFLRQPNGDLADEASITEALQAVDVIRPLIRRFELTSEAEGDYLDRMQHYSNRPRGHAARAWAHHLTPDPLPTGIHVQDPATGRKAHPHYIYWPEGTKVSNNEWTLEHYPIRSIEHAARKAAERDWLMPIPGRTPRYQGIRRAPRSALRSESGLNRLPDSAVMP